MHVSIIGGSIWGNRGAEAMVTTCIGYIRQRWPDARISVFSYFPRQDSILIQDEQVSIVDASPFSLVLKILPFALACRIASLLKLRIPDYFLPVPVRHLRESRLLLDVFGISFADGRTLFLPFNVLSLLPAFLLSVPVIKLSQALGPFRSSLNRFAAQLTLRRCKYIFARGEETAKHLQSLALPVSTYEMAADIAFLYEPRFSLSSEGDHHTLKLREALNAARRRAIKVIAICPSAVVFKKAKARQIAYIDILSDAIVRLLDSHYDVLVLPHATRAGYATLRNNDLPVIEAVKQRCGQTLQPSMLKHVHWVNYDIGSQGIRTLLELTDALITSRFHAMIAALSLGVPPIVLGWSHKYGEVLRQFQIEDACFDIDTLDMDAFKAQIERMSQPDFRDAWDHMNHLATAKSSAARQFSYVIDQLQS